MWDQSNLTSLGVGWPKCSCSRRGQQVYGGFAEVCREAGGEQQRSVVVMFDACLGCVWHRCWWQGKHKPGLSPLLLFLALIWRSQVPISVASRPHGTTVYLLPWGVWGWWGWVLPSSAGLRRLALLTSSYNLMGRAVFFMQLAFELMYCSVGLHLQQRSVFSSDIYCRSS